MRSFTWLCLCAFASFGCHRWDEVDAAPARTELIEISLPQPGDRLLYALPDAGWRRVEEASFRGFLYGKEGKTLRVTIVLKEDRFEDAVAEARAAAASEEIRAFSVGRSWPFVGIILAYRGPPDAPLLDAFIMSFKVERR